MIPGTLRDLFTYNDQAQGKLLAVAAERTDDELDRPFEMGEGSLRKTLCHLWRAELCWLSRWRGDTFDESDPAASVAEIADGTNDTAARREQFLATHDAASIASSFRYKRPGWMGPGPDLELPFDISMLHVLNHGVHHRAQAINMIKRLGAKPPTLDYIVLRLSGPAPRLDLPTLRRYHAYGDWAHRQVYEAAAALGDEARNREFPIGPGTLRRIVRHLADAPGWWLDNIENGPGANFPATEETDAWDDLWSLYTRVARRRDAFLGTLTEDDLLRPVDAVPRPGIERSWPLGVILLQLCVHGTHHRAQALNMLRLSEADVPELDVAIWHRRGEPSPF